MLERLQQQLLQFLGFHRSSGSGRPGYEQFPFRCGTLFAAPLFSISFEVLHGRQICQAQGTVPGAQAQRYVQGARSAHLECRKEGEPQRRPEGVQEEKAHVMGLICADPTWRAIRASY
jgi:hypothetical protein